MKKHFHRFTTHPYAFLDSMSLAALFLYLIPSLPSFSPVPFIDAAVFLYIGWQWKEGLVPYRDLWDHKPPLIYLLDAAGYALTDGQAGPWLLETMLIISAFLLLAYLLYQRYGEWGAAVSFPAFWSAFQHTYIRNMTENIALPWQVGILYLAGKTRWRLRHFALLGVLTALLLMSRPNIALGGILLLLYILWTKHFEASLSHVQAVLVWLCGVFIVWLPLLFYFWVQNALDDFFEAVILFNLAYQNAGQGVPWFEIFLKIFRFLPDWLIWTTTVGVTTSWFTSRKRSAQLPFVLLLAGDAIAVGLPRRAVVHYAMNLVPTMAYWSAIGLLFILQYWFRTLADAGKRKWAWASMAFVILWLSLVPNQIIWWLQPNKYEHQEYVNAAQFLQRYTSPDETVFLWGEIRVNVLARRRSPTKYVVFPPTYTPDREKHLRRLLLDLEHASPIFVVDTYKSGVSVWDLWRDSPTLSTQAEQLRERYIPVHQMQVGKRTWVFYILASEYQRVR